MFKRKATALGPDECAACHYTIVGELIISPSGYAYPCGACRKKVDALQTLDTFRRKRKLAEDGVDRAWENNHI